MAAELADEFPDGVFWVALAGVGDPDLVPATIGGTIGASDRLADHIGGKRMLLLLDNFEQVLEAAAAIGDLLRGCANLKALVTSRAPLRVASEHEYQVDPLPETDAVTLFTERASSVVHDFDPDDAVAEICSRLDGLPLAIELAAARVRVLGTGELLSRLEQRLPLLTGGARDAPERQRTLRATIEWSYDLLGSDEQRLFGRMAIFAGSFDLAAAEKVCAASLDEVEALVEQSLVRRWASGRLGMLETIREFGLERLAESGEHDVVARAHAEHFLALAKAAERKGAIITAASLTRVDPERDNCRAAMRWALDGGEPLLALRIAAALGPFWIIRAHEEGLSWLTETLDATPDVPAELRAGVLRDMGAMNFMAGDYERAAALVEQALEMFRELGDEPATALALDMLAGGVATLGDAARARTLADESLALFRKLDDRHSALYPLLKVAGDEWNRGDRELGAALTEEALGLARGVGDAWSQALTLNHLAEQAWNLGDSARADMLARESISLANELGNTFALISGLALLAVVAAAAGDIQRAGRLWGVVEVLEEEGTASLAPGDRERYQQTVTTLGGDELAAAIVRGRAMTFEEAVELALSPG